MRTLTILFLLILASPARADITSSLEELLQVIQERLDLALPVALYKWDHGRPVEDPEREARVIAGARTQAAQFAIAAHEAEQLLRDQIDASKYLQHVLQNQWLLAGQAPDIPRQDLARQVRPQLDDLQTRLLQSYAGFRAWRTHPDCPTKLAEGLRRLSRDTAHDNALRLASSRVCAFESVPARCALC